MKTLLEKWLKKAGLDAEASADRVLEALEREATVAPELMEALLLSPTEAHGMAAARFLIRGRCERIEAILERAFEHALTSVRAELVGAAALHEEHFGHVAARLHDDTEVAVRVAAAQALALIDTPRAFEELVRGFENEEEQECGHACAKAIEAHIRRSGGLPADVAPPRDELLVSFRNKLMVLGRRHFPRFLEWIKKREAEATARSVDLSSYGTDLSSEARGRRLERTFGLDQVIATMRAMLLGEPPKSIVLMGPAGCGKTAAVHALVYELLRDEGSPWQIVRISPFEMLAGTKYLGEWQTRIRELVSAVSRPRRVILYVPNLEQLAETGRSSNSDMNVATALAPFIERGDVVIIGETTPEAFRSGVGADPSLRRLFHVVEMNEATTDATRELLTHVGRDLGIDADAALLDRVTELADYYLAGSAQPGRAVGLLRRFADLAAATEQPLTESTLVKSLSSATGIPEEFLLDSVPLDEERIRTFFQTRVMGQDEAVDALVDLVTLIKAGLTDPGKPFGVLLFVGPTGVGKTELARALAELLFGSQGRLLRYDMSEFATFEAFERLIGRAGTSGLLTSAVQNQPFSVILFDEIEKGHANVFDLCLQVFDAGRLTDGSGKTADLRRSIIILTSNVGAGAAKDAALGFSDKAPEPADRDATMRELGRFFRPEFLNRLDRIVFFKPLTAEIAERIVRRELDRVLERNGIVRRRLALDIDPAVPALLLREGYSQTFGARPLKRTIERLLLLPVARAIAKGRVATGSVIHLHVVRERVDVRITAPTDAESERTPSAERVQATKRADVLVRLADIYSSNVDALRTRCADLVRASGSAEFWQDERAARSTLDLIHRIEGIVAVVEGFEKSSRGAHERSSIPQLSLRDAARLDDWLDGLEEEAEHVGFLSKIAHPEKLRDAIIVLTLVSSQGRRLDAVERLAKMYINFARRRRFEIEIIDDHSNDDPREDSVALIVHGPASWVLLANEAGLHQVSHGAAKGERHEAREIVRVEVLPCPHEEPTIASRSLRIQATKLKGRPARLDRAPTVDVTLFHDESMTSVRAWSSDDKDTTVERLRLLLEARLERARIGAKPRDKSAVVRRYVLGAAPLVRDARTNKRSGLLDRIFDGYLDGFLVIDAASDDPA